VAQAGTVTYLFPPPEPINMTEGSAGHAVRVRGIYATALTRLLLEAGHDVVQGSPALRGRFDADLPPGDPDATILTTDDRQGVAVAGESAAVDALRDLLTDVAIDTLAWPDPAPEDAVFDGVVTETLGDGAVVDLGDTEGFLPFRRVDDTVDEGDAVRVQVTAAAVPWGTDRPVLDTGPEFQVQTGMATLTRDKSGVRVEGGDDAAGRELARMTGLLSAEPLAGWGLEWARDARDAGMDALEAGLERAAAQATALEDALDEEPAPVRTVAMPGAGAWAWFGRESRFALDDVRREVTATMPGHHRIKAGSSAASAGIDFAEAVCGDQVGEGSFPFAAVTEQFGPRKGDRIRIDHGKPTGERIVLGRGDVVEYDTDGSLAVERQMSSGGTYDALGVPREAGDTALTKFREGRWWYPTAYRDADGDHKGTYVNVCTPVELFPDAVRYVDLEVDVIRYPDGRVERVDDAELTEAVEAGLVSEELAERAREVAASLENAL
jgi:Ribonuclease G/E